MLARDELFEGVTQGELTLQGHPLKVPIFYRDASAVTAIFPAHAGKLQRLLPRDELRVAPLAPGVGAVGVTFFDYRDTDIGPYLEMGVAIPVVYGQRPVPLATVARQMRTGTLHAWVQQLPVTTEIARVGGVDLYGYPKILADIDFETRDDRFHTELRVEGRRVLALDGGVPEGELSDVPQRYVTYAMRDGRLVEGQVLMYAESLSRTYRARGVGLELDTSHAIGRELDDVLLARWPMHLEHVSRFRSILHAPNFLE